MTESTEAFDSEYAALTVGCGVTSLADWTTLAIVGDDRLSFLHNMCSNDIRRLVAGTGCEAFCTDVKGKIVSHLFVIAREDRLELLTVPNQAETLAAHLDRYIIREDVRLLDETEQRTWWLVSGSKSAEVVASFVTGETNRLKAPWQHIPFQVNGISGLVVRSPLFWPEGFLLQCKAEERSKLSELLQEAGALACCAGTSSNEALEALRIESGFPLYGVDFRAENLPQEVDRDTQAISFNKGCYLGQETIARIDALGHVNQKIVSVLFAEANVPPTNLELRHGDKIVGRVTSACWSPREKSPLALALVRRGSNHVGTPLESDVGPAMVVPIAEHSG